jgi:hypothetical protein
MQNTDSQNDLSARENSNKEINYFHYYNKRINNNIISVDISTTTTVYFF